MKINFFSKPMPRFFGLVLLFSVPLWLAAAFFDATKVIPVKLPFSALQFLSVLLAVVLVARAQGQSVRKLLLRGFDFDRIHNPAWRAGIFLLMPFTICLAFGMIVWSGAVIPNTQTPLWVIPVFLLIYGISGYCEQIGWTAFMTDELLARRYSLLLTGLLVGLTWAVWHIIPFIQTHNTAGWIFWQCLYTITYRVLLTKVYVLTNRSVFSTIAMHATYNTAFSMMPYYGSSYNPMFMVAATLIVTLLVFGADRLRRSRSLA